MAIEQVEFAFLAFYQTNVPGSEPLIMAIEQVEFAFLAFYQTNVLIY